MLNSIGLQNVGVEAFVREKMPYLRKMDTALIVNVGGGPVEEFVHVTERLADCDGIDALEINMSCPNVSGGMDFSTDPRRAAELVTALRGLTNLPLIAKLTPERYGYHANRPERGGKPALTRFRPSTPFRAWRSTSGRAVPCWGPSRVACPVPRSSPWQSRPIYGIASQVSIPVIGIGGIMCAEDAVEFLVAGATAVQIGTANFVEPTAGATVAREMAEWCAASEVQSVRGLIGSIQIPSQEDESCHPS